MIPLADQIKCVGREIGLRKNVYPRRVARGQMTDEEATRELATMEAVYATLKMIQQAKSDPEAYGCRS